MAVPVRADAARTAPVEFTSAEHAASFIEANCLRDGPVGQVGLEIEA
ncbi:ergothioneine biosynthesis glutamate--cysteine ligase EgtA, partial [Mycolicibacterium fortuitum]